MLERPQTAITPYHSQLRALRPPSSFGGYDIPYFEYVSHIGLYQGGVNPNSLFGGWNFTKAAHGSLAALYSDGSSIPALVFGGTTIGSYDIFSQTVATTVGDSYTLDFAFLNSVGAISTGLLVTEWGGFGPVTPPPLLPPPPGGGVASGVPEISTWSMMLLGFLGLGFARFGRGRFNKVTRAAV
jgi:hypothetical protein